ncbi:MAG: flagellar hook-basal body complex protein [Candidatus Binataceae bacterium]|jgi:flagellar hook protein FlgE
MSGNTLSITQTGLQAVDTALQAVSDDLANANTTGFQSESVDFGTLLGSTIGDGALGGGVDVTGIDRDFSQGAIVQTNSPTDMAIQGTGFFVYQDSSGTQVYSRDGSTAVAANGTLEGPDGAALQGFSLNAAGLPTGVLGSITIPQGSLALTASANVAVNGNLDSTSTVIGSVASPVPINPSDSTTYDSSVSVQVYDSLGNSHVLTFYFQNGGPDSSTPPNEVWNWEATLDGSTTGLANNTGSFSFDNAGDMVAGSVPASALTATVAGAAPLSLALNFGSMTQFASSNSASGTADGNAVGAPLGVQINSSGLVSVSYSNGQSANVGQVAIATFPSEEGLALNSQGLYQQTSQSGSPTIGTAGATSSGSIVNSSTESSNVDTTSALVSLVVLQRSFQANSKALQTEDSVQGYLDQLVTQ